MISILSLPVPRINLAFPTMHRLRTPVLRPIRANPGVRVFVRSNASVTTPKQVTSPAIAPPASSYIRGTRKPIGGFRGGITGFFLGTSIAAAYGYYYLLTTLSAQSGLLNAAISDLQLSTTALQSYISKINSLENDFKRLEEKAVDKETLEGVRDEFKKVVAGVRGEGLELKERLVGLESDVAMLTRTARTQVQSQS